MKVLIVGGGGREHALAWLCMRAGADVFAAPGNPGMGEVAWSVPVAEGQLPAWARNNGVNLVVIGDAAPLQRGLADLCRTSGLPVFGPDALWAQLETSKWTAKEFMDKHWIPTARPWVVAGAPTWSATVRRAGRAGWVEVVPDLALAGEVNLPVAVKADGLAGGRGVHICTTAAEVDAAIAVLRPEGMPIIVEPALTGSELSVFYFVADGQAQLFGAARDYKRLRDGDQGPNTGGMGAITVELEPALAATIEERIVRPTVQACPEYRGVLYLGLMLTADGPVVLEYNVRFGDPEMQALSMLAQPQPFLSMLLAVAEGELRQPGVPMLRPGVGVSVALVNSAYPNEPGRSGPIAGGRALSDWRRMHERAFCAGIAENSAGDWLACGGRVLHVAARGEDAGQAVGRAYAAVGRVGFRDIHFRTDIGRPQPA